MGNSGHLLVSFIGHFVFFTLCVRFHCLHLIVQCCKNLLLYVLLCTASSHAAWLIQWLLRFFEGFTGTLVWRRRRKRRGGNCVLRTRADLYWGYIWSVQWQSVCWRSHVNLELQVFFLSLELFEHTVPWCGHTHTHTPGGSLKQLMFGISSVLCNKLNGHTDSHSHSLQRAGELQLVIISHQFCPTAATWTNLFSQLPLQQEMCLW